MEQDFKVQGSLPLKVSSSGDQKVISRQYGRLLPRKYTVAWHEVQRRSWQIELDFKLII